MYVAVKVRNSFLNPMIQHAIWLFPVQCPLNVLREFLPVKGEKGNQFTVFMVNDIKVMIRAIPAIL